MATKLCDLTIDELAASFVATERAGGSSSDGVAALKAEVARRPATDKSAFDGAVARARRFAALIDIGYTMNEFKSPGFSRADRALAKKLGADGAFGFVSNIRFSQGGFNAFKKPGK